jgi:hypothetical protein
MGTCGSAPLQHQRVNVSTSTENARKSLKVSLLFILSTIQNLFAPSQVDLHACGLLG